MRSLTNSLQQFSRKGLCLMLSKGKRFVENSYVLAKEEEEQDTLVERVDKTYTGYKMETKAKKTKRLAQSANDTHMEINRIYDGVEAETRKSQASFQII